MVGKYRMSERFSRIINALSEAYRQHEYLTTNQAIQEVESKIGELTRREKKEIAYHVEVWMMMDRDDREEDNKGEERP